MNRLVPNIGEGDDLGEHIAVVRGRGGEGEMRTSGRTVVWFQSRRDQHT